VFVEVVIGDIALGALKNWEGIQAWMQTVAIKRKKKDIWKIAIDSEVRLKKGSGAEGPSQM
jgi:hypothetical protein